MNSNLFQEIETERLLLRKLKTSDWKVISFLRSNEEINRFVKRPSAKTKEEALKFISKIDDGIENNNLLYWTITEKNNNSAIGTICLWNFSEDRKTAETGFDLIPEYQGKGIMSESLKSILQFGFEILKLDSIIAFTNKNNKSSKRVLERNNFKFMVDKKDEYDQDNIVYELKK